MRARTCKCARALRARLSIQARVTPPLAVLAGRRDIEVRLVRGTVLDEGDQRCRSLILAFLEMLAANKTSLKTFTVLKK